MQKKSRGNCQPLFHALLYFGVLAGLLFSSGEGIRLFPFPSPASAQNEKSFLSDGKKSDYKENVFRFKKANAAFQNFRAARRISGQAFGRRKNRRFLSWRLFFKLILHLFGAFSNHDLFPNRPEAARLLFLKSS